MGDAAIEWPTPGAGRTTRRTGDPGRRRLLAVAALALSLVAAACSNSSGNATGSPAAPPGSVGTSIPGGGEAEKVAIEGVPGVTDDEIAFTIIGTKAGNPLGTCILDCFADGIDAYFAFRNSQGGVQGRQLVVAKQLDDEVGQNQVRALEVTSDQDSFGVFNAPLLASGFETLAEARIPTYVWAINFIDMAGHDSIYGNLGVTCVSCSQRGTIYAAKDSGATKVAALGYGVTQASKDCVESQRRSVEMHGDELGIEMVYTNPELPYGLANGVAPEVTAMKEAGVDFIFTCIDLNGTKTFAQELERQGMADVPMLHQNTYDHAFVAEGDPLFEGDILAPRFRPFEASNEGALADYFEWIDQTGSARSELAMVGWINADIAYQGLLAAGPDFDREKVIAATNAMTDYSADGLLNPIDWSRQHEPATEDDPTTHGYATECISLIRVGPGGSFDLIGDPDKPFLCWSNANKDWSDPEPTDIE